MTHLESAHRTVVVAGSSGLIGSALVSALRRDGTRVRTLVRRPARDATEVQWDPSRGVLPSSALEHAGAVVNLAGVGVGDRRWSDAHKAAILGSRLATTDLLARRLADSASASTVLVQASAIGFYGDRGDEVLTESSAGGSGFLADVVREWEAAAAPASEAGVRVALARTGIVLARDGGALGRLLPLVRLGLGGRLGSGQQFWSWITLDDEIRALRFLIDTDVRGPVNLTAPEPARNAAIVTALGRAYSRPTPLAVPAVALRIALGEFSSEILGSQRVLPRALQDAGFTFDHPDVTTASRWVRGGVRS